MCRCPPREKPLGPAIVLAKSSVSLHLLKEANGLASAALAARNGTDVVLAARAVASIRPRRVGLVAGRRCKPIRMGFSATCVYVVGEPAHQLGQKSRGEEFVEIEQLKTRPNRGKEGMGV